MIARAEARAQGEVVAWVGVIAAAWIASLWMEAVGVAHLLHHHTIFHSGHLLAGGLELVVAWQVMTVAMMLPGTLPALLSAPSRLRFVWTYLASWTVFAVLAFGGDMALHALVHGWPVAAQHENLIPVALLVAAALYQLLPWKARSLAACRRHDAGTSYSVSCIASSWALMLIMFSAGVADLLWMVALAAAMLAEKVLPSPDRVRYAIAAALAVMAVATLATPL